MIKRIAATIFAVSVVLAGLAPAFATRSIPIKPDGAHAAPMTVFGDTVNGVSIGKTTAPTGALDVVGNINATGIISGTIDSTKIPNNAIDTAKIANAAVTVNKVAANAIDTGKIAAQSVDTGKLLTGGSIDTVKFLCSSPGLGSRFGWATMEQILAKICP